MVDVLSLQARERNEEIHLSDFQKVAEAEERRIYGLISCPRAQWNDPTWSDDIEDPEFQKNLRIVSRLIAQALELCARLGRRDDDRALRAELVARLRHRLVLPDDLPLTLPVLLGHRFGLELLRVELGDETYVR